MATDNHLGKLAQAMKVLRSFGTSTPELSVTQIAAELGLPKSSASRLMKEMREEDLLVQDPLTKQYRPGFFLYHLGNIYEQNLRLFPLLVESLQNLVKETGFTGFIGLLDGQDLLPLRSIQGRHPIHYIFKAGRRMPAYAITGGLCLLSRMQDEDVKQLYPDEFDSGFAHAPRKMSELLVELREVRERGWAQTSVSSFSNVSAIGVSVASADGREAYGYSLSYPTEYLDGAGICALRQKIVKSAITLGVQTGDRFWNRISAV